MLDKSWLEASLWSPATAELPSIVWVLGSLRYIIGAGVQYGSLSSAGDSPEAGAALNHGDNEREFNHASVNLSLSLSHKPDVQRLFSPSRVHPYVCLFTVAEHRLSQPKLGSSLRIMSGRRLHRHCGPGPQKQDTERGACPGLTLLRNTVIPQARLIPSVSLSSLSPGQPC